MKVKTSRQMVKFLRDNIKLKCVSNFYLQQVSSNYYSMFVSPNSNENLDYSDKTGKYNVIVIVYDISCYAQNRYLTTSDLIRLYRKSNGTVEDFIKEIEDEIAI